MMNTDEKASHCMHQLEIIKDIKQKTNQLENIKMKLNQTSNYVDNEDHWLDEYKAEMEHLLQEKMAHVEELRLIHADINQLETTIKQAEEERNNAIETAKKLYSEYMPLKDEVDRLRNSFGLSPLLENLDDCEKLPVELVQRKPKSTVMPYLDHHSDYLSDCSSSLPIHHFMFPSSAAGVSSVATSHIPMQPKPSTAPHSPSGPGPSALPGFRQQPPPMKACLSCHQQIHRNAPICPLCKAKSRSRNPKKPKKKADD